MNHKTTRRQLLYQSAITAISMPFITDNLLAKPHKAVGLQLYTLRDSIGKDPEGVLRKVSEIGYNEVETFGYASGKYFGKTPKELRALLSSLSLSTPSGHYMPNNLKKDWNKAVDHAAQVEQKFMVCAFIFPNERKNTR